MVGDLAHAARRLSQFVDGPGKEVIGHVLEHEGVFRIGGRNGDDRDANGQDDEGDPSFRSERSTKHGNGKDGGG